MTPGDSQLRSKAESHRKRISDLTAKLRSAKADFAIENQIWPDLENWPPSLRAKYEDQVRAFDLQSVELDSADVRRVWQQMRIPPSLQLNDSQERVDYWISISDHIGRRLQHLDQNEQNEDSGQVEMLLSELGLSVLTPEMGGNYPGDVFGVVGPLLWIFREKREAFRKAAVVSIVRDERLWEAVEWTPEQLKLFDSNHGAELAELRSQESGLNQIPLDLRFEDSWYQYSFRLNTVDGCLDEEVVDIRELSIKQLEDLVTVFPHYRTYLFEKQNS